MYYVKRDETDILTPISLALAEAIGVVASACKNRKIETIKIFRGIQMGSVSLRDAKDIVEAVGRFYNIEWQCAEDWDEQPVPSRN